jgi:hypothetical protein
MSTITVESRHSEADRAPRRHHRAGPAYLRGLPAWMWRSALAGRRA